MRSVDCEIKNNKMGLQVLFRGFRGYKDCVYIKRVLISGSGMGGYHPAPAIAH